MLPFLLKSLAVLAVSNPHLNTEAAEDDGPSWADRAAFFVGVRGGVGFSPGAQGPSPTFGVELGVSNTRGVGFGIHLIGAMNTDQVDWLGIPRTNAAFGGEADLRIYIQTVEPLTLYPTVSLGFLSGQAVDTGRNAVLPLLNLGFGARVRLASMYASVEIGLASFHIPFLTLGLGFETKPRVVALEEEHHAALQKQPAQAPVVPPPPAEPTPVDTLQ